MNRLVVVSGLALIAALIVSCATPVPCDGYWRADAHYQLTCDLGRNTARWD